MSTPRSLAAVLAFAILASSCGSDPGVVAPTGPVTASEQGGGLGEARHEAGAVEIVASWIDGATPALRVVMDTHSVSLDGFDLGELARVRLDGGPWIAPSGWDAPAGGHHRSGTLTFGSIDPGALAAARLIELEIRDVAVPSHLLRWERAG